MALPTVSLSEATPAGSDQIALGDNRLREYKTQNREILEVDHTYPSSGQSADAGTHKKCSFIEQADLGTGAVGKTLLGSQTVSGKGELVYSDEDNNDIQITKGGVLKPSASTVLADWSAIMGLVYPIGIVVTLGVSTNPATLLGIGTWTAIAGKVIVGIDAGQTEFDTLDETGGAKTVTLTAAQSGLPAHSHGLASHLIGSGGSNISAGSQSSSNPTNTNSNTAEDAAEAHSNLQPYIVKYVWQRTS